VLQSAGSLLILTISALRKSQPSPKVVRWLTGFRDSDLFLRVVSLGEIERGIEKKGETDPVFA
jgi:predicted nucleic acid-binding protein